MSNQKKVSVKEHAANAMVASVVLVTAAMLELETAGRSVLALAKAIRSSLFNVGVMSDKDPEEQARILTAAFRDNGGSPLLATFARPFALLLCLVNVDHPKVAAKVERMVRVVVYHTSACTSLFRTLAVFGKATKDSVLSDRTPLSGVRKLIADELAYAVTGKAGNVIEPRAGNVAAAAITAYQTAFPFPYILEPTGNALKLVDVTNPDGDYATATVLAATLKLAAADKAVQERRAEYLAAHAARKLEAEIEADRIAKRDAAAAAAAIAAGTEEKNAQHAKDMLAAAQEKADKRAAKVAAANAETELERIGVLDPSYVGPVMPPVTAAGKATLRRMNAKATETAARMPANVQ